MPIDTKALLAAETPESREDAGKAFGDAVKAAGLVSPRARRRRARRRRVQNGSDTISHLPV